MSNSLQFEWREAGSLTPHPRNSRKHSDAQIESVASSLYEFGWTRPVVVDDGGVILAGHGATRSAIALYDCGLVIRDAPAGMVPVVVKTGLTDAQKRAYVIADNKLAEESDWDEDILGEELAWLADMDFGAMHATGFSDADLGAILNAANAASEEGLTDPDDAPEVAGDDAQPVSRTGDVWLLGGHRVMCGDSTSADDVARLMNGETAALVHADPPYGMGKEGDGVANDNLYREKLDAFQMEWWRAFRPHLADNGSAYIWGNAPDLWRLWYVGGLADSERMTFRNEIAWAKLSTGGVVDAMGKTSDELRSYPPATERCLFFMLGEQGFNNNADNYWDGFEPIRSYLQEQRDLMGWNNKIVAGFFGFHPRMADHWFSKSQWSFPREEQYEKLQAAADGVAFRRDYDDLRRDFYATRAHFDNTHDKMTDVWEFPRVTGEERHGHATPKPVAMMERVMKSSLPDGGLCAEPFGGSGSTLMGAERTGRRCYTMEMQGKYVDVIVKRWQAYTGKAATLEGDGRTFDEVAVAREALAA